MPSDYLYSTPSSSTFTKSSPIAIRIAFSKSTSSTSSDSSKSQESDQPSRPVSPNLDRSYEDLEINELTNDDVT